MSGDATGDQSDLFTTKKSSIPKDNHYGSA